MFSIVLKRLYFRQGLFLAMPKKDTRGMFDYGKFSLTEKKRILKERELAI